VGSGLGKYWKRKDGKTGGSSRCAEGLEMRLSLSLQLDLDFTQVKKLVA
jgi:hypothetical protein